MELDDRIDGALAELPVWVPPPHFARRVVAGSTLLLREAAAARPSRLFWIWTAAQAASVAGLAYLGSLLVSRAATSIALTAGSVIEQYMRSLSRSL